MGRRGQTLLCRDKGTGHRNTPRMRGHRRVDVPRLRWASQSLAPDLCEDHSLLWGCPGHCGGCYSISCLYSLHASSTPQVVTTNNASRHHQLSPEDGE